MQRTRRRGPSWSDPELRRLWSSRRVTPYERLFLFRWYSGYLVSSSAATPVKLAGGVTRLFALIVRLWWGRGARRLPCDGAGGHSRGNEIEDRKTSLLLSGAGVLSPTYSVHFADIRILSPRVISLGL